MKRIFPTQKLFRILQSFRGTKIIDQSSATYTHSTPIVLGGSEQFVLVATVHRLIIDIFIFLKLWQMQIRRYTYFLFDHYVLL